MYCEIEVCVDSALECTRMDDCEASTPLHALLVLCTQRNFKVKKEI